MDGAVEPLQRDVRAAADSVDFLAIGEDARTHGDGWNALRAPVTISQSQDLLSSNHDPIMGNFTASVNGDLTDRSNSIFRLFYRTMNLKIILDKVERRLKDLGLTANEASKASGKSQAIRNLQRAVRDGKRKGVSTQTLAALAPVLEVTSAWLLDDRIGVNADGMWSVWEQADQAQRQLIVDLARVVVKAPIASAEQGQIPPDESLPRREPAYR